jgi:hypothetical protein
MSSDREFINTAMRWFAARGKRMAAKKHKFNCDSTACFGTARAQIEAADKLKEARRQERAALRALAKACEVQRGQQVEDACTVQMMEVTT